VPQQAAPVVSSYPAGTVLPTRSDYLAYGRSARV